MTTTGNITTDIAIIWAPLVLAVIMGLIGLLRGARREAVVSLSIVLAALIITVWARSWASDLHDSFSGMSQVDIETWLGVIVFVLITLVIGYGTGSAVTARGPLSGMSRLGGLIIGLANGAAFGGWLLRNYFDALLTDLSGQNSTIYDTLTTNIISRGLIIWAGWFSLVVALAAAIVALVGPFRRAQTVVATPSAQTNWQPSTAPAATPATAMPTSYTPQYSQPYAQPQQYTQPYAQQYPPQFGAQPQAPVQPAPAPAVVSTPSSYNAAPPSSVPTTRVQEAPPTMPMPTGNETLYMGGSSSSPSSGPLGSSGVRSGPITGPLGDTTDHTQAQSSTPAWAQAPDSSWLSAPKSGGSSSPADNPAVARSEAPTLAYQVNSGGAPSSPSSVALTNCPRCGALVPGDAAFCTECGNRLKG